MINNSLIPRINQSITHDQSLIKSTDVNLHYREFIDLTSANNKIISVKPVLIAHISSQNGIMSVKMDSTSVILRNMYLLDRITPVIPNEIYVDLFHNDETSDQKQHEKHKIYMKYFEEYINAIKLDRILALLTISQESTRYKQRFICNNERLVSDITINQQTDMIEKYDVSIKANIDTILIVSKQTFLEQSLETYSDDTSIVTQYLSDLPRQNVIINNIHIKEGKNGISAVEHMLSILSKFNREIKLDTDIKNRKTISTTLLAIAFVCQTSFYMSFIHLHDKCSKMRASMEADPSLKDDPRLNMYALDLKEKDTVSISISHNMFKCSFMARYRIVDISTEKIIHIVRTETIIDMDKDIGVIVYEAM
jgi:hypothetical protein